MGTEYAIFQIGWYPLIIEITAKNLKPTDIIIGDTSWKTLLRFITVDNRTGAVLFKSHQRSA